MSRKTPSFSWSEKGVQSQVHEPSTLLWNHSDYTLDPEAAADILCKHAPVLVSAFLKAHVAAAIRQQAYLRALSPSLSASLCLTEIGWTALAGRQRSRHKTIATAWGLLVTSETSHSMWSTNCSPPTWMEILTHTTSLVCLSVSMHVTSRICPYVDAYANLCRCSDERPHESL